MSARTGTGPAPASAGVGQGDWGWTAAAAMALAGVLHLVAAVDHLGWGELVVGFFLGTGLGQLAAGAWLAVAAATGTRPATVLLTGLLAATVALLVLYLVAHSTELLAGVAAPGVGEHHEGTAGAVALGDAPAGLREPPGLLGTATVAVEIVALLACTALLPARRRRLAGNVVAALGGAIWLSWLTGALG